MAYPGRPASPVYLKTASRYSSDLSAVSCLTPVTRPNKELETFSKILDIRHRVLEGFEDTSPLHSHLGSLSRFNLSFRSILIHFKLSCSQFVRRGRTLEEGKKEVSEREREETRTGRIKKARGRWANSSNHASRCLVINRVHENELLRHQRPSRSSQ